MHYTYQQHVQFSACLYLEARSTPIYVPSNHADCVLNLDDSQPGFHTDRHLKPTFSTSFSYVRMHVQHRVQASSNTYNTGTHPHLTLHPQGPCHIEPHSFNSSND